MEQSGERSAQTGESRGGRGGEGRRRERACHCASKLLLNEGLRPRSLTEAFLSSFFVFSKPWKPKRPTLADLPLRSQWEPGKYVSLLAHAAESCVTFQAGASPSDVHMNGFSKFYSTHTNHMFTLKNFY